MTVAIPRKPQPGSPLMVQVVIAPTNATTRKLAYMIHCERDQPGPRSAFTGTA